MRRTLIAIVAGGLLLLGTPAAFAHFQVLLPDTDVLTGASRPLQLDIRFTHPAVGGPTMAMGVPRRFGVFFQGHDLDLKKTLVPVSVDGRRAFRSSFTPPGPADYIFYIEPAPYWEPSEGKMIIHYTKVVVDGFGAEDGWDRLVGLPVEIEPLVRPYGLWAGNVFRGVVRRNGRPVPHATVEVEYYNDGHRLQLPAPAFATQVIKADERGVFCYAMPFEGWWGFAALLQGERQLSSPEGKPVAVELGGLMWVRTRQPKFAP